MINDISLLPLLAEFLGKSAVVLLAGLVIQAAIRRLPVSPAFRHSLWISLFSAILLLPFCQLYLPGIGILPVEVTAATTGVSVATSESVAISSPALSTSDGKAFPGFSRTQILTGLWLTGFLFFLVRSIIGVVYLRRIEATASSPEKDLKDRITDLLSRVKTGRNIRVIVSPRVKTPFTFGILRPRIVLPKAILQESDQDLEMIVLHEIEHIRRYDALSVWISRLFLALNWVNPLAWTACRQSRHFREEACDLRVISAGHSSASYAEMLLRQAKVASRSCLQISATAVAETGTIEKRIKMILNPQNLFKAKSEHPAAGMFAKTTTLLSILAVAALGAIGKVESAGNSEMDSLIVPRVEFTATPLADAVAFLQLKSREADPAKKGINVIIQPDMDKTARINLKLTNVPAIEALRYTAKLAGGDIKIEDHAVLIGKFPPSEEVQQPGDIEANKRKMQSLIIPSIEFIDTPLTDALRFLQQKSVELDVKEQDRNKKGINVILESGPVLHLNGYKIANPTKITLRLTDVPLEEAIRYTCNLAQYEYVVEPHAIIVRGKE
ncbi:MAG: M56 family metallopeptidase [Verrucomicrobiales bacterium]|nr:M56 family metallopeptidase [Verrucomicrobiales bacterium]